MLEIHIHKKNFHSEVAILISILYLYTLKEKIVELNIIWHKYLPIPYTALLYADGSNNNDSYSLSHNYNFLLA